nr:ORF2 [Alternaria botybirnavirus 2]
MSDFYTIGVEDKMAGADAGASAAGPSTDAPPPSDANVPNDEAGLAPVDMHDEIFEDLPLDIQMDLEPPGGSEEHHPPPGEAPTGPPANGDQYGPIPEAEDAVDPLDEVPQTGWFDYEYSDDVGKTLRYGGTTTSSDGAVNYVTKLGTQLTADLPLFDGMKRRFDGIVDTGPFAQAHIASTWGMGSRQASSYVTQANFTDSRTVNYITTNAQVENMSTSEDNILYRVQAGVTVTGRLVRQNTVFNMDEVRKIKMRVNDIGVAERYRDMTTTAVVRGCNYITFLTIAYTRILTLGVWTEMGLAPKVHTDGASLNRRILHVPNPNANPFRAAVDAYLQYRPNGLVTLPPGSSYGDIVTMLYLMGVGRTVFQTPRGEEDVNVFSPFDRFVPTSTLDLSPLLDDSKIELYAEKELRAPITLHAAQDLLTRYVDTNQLWTQMSIARNMAWGMVISREFSASLSLPRPVHSFDPLFNSVNLGSDHIGTRRVARQDDPFCALIGAGTWLAASMIEVLFEGSVNTIETSAGIGPRAKNFLAAVDTRQDDLGLDLGIGHAILPVVDRITGTPSTHIKQYLASSVVGLFKHLGLGWEHRPVRISSYLATHTTPEEPALQLYFNQAKRTALVRQRYYTWRESVVASHLLDSVSGTQIGYISYGSLYDDAIDEARIYAPFQGTLGRNQVEHMVGEPTLWDLACTSERIEIIRADELIDAQEGNNIPLDSATSSLFDALRQAMLGQPATGSKPLESKTTAPRNPDNFQTNPTRQGQLPLDARQGKGKGRAVVSHSDVEDVQAGWSQAHVGRNTRGEKARPGPTAPLRGKPVKSGFVPSAVHNIESKNTFAPLSIEDRTAGYEDPQDKKDSSKPVKRATSKAVRTTSPRDLKAEERRQAKRDEEAMSASIALNLEERERIIRDFPKTQQECRALDMLFPRGKDAELKRAPYTIGSLLGKLRTASVVTREMRSDISTFIRSGAGGKNAWAVAVVQFITLNDLSRPAYEHLVERGLLTTKYEHWNDKWSNINDEFRNSVHTESWQFSNTDFPQCLYLAGFVGRPHREADWEAEKEKRGAQPVPIRHYTSNGFKDIDEAQEKRMILDFLYAEANFKVKRVQPFQEYYESRAEWMIRGSMSGEKTVLDTVPEVRSKLAEMGLKVQQHTTKVHVAEKVDYNWFKQVLEMEPIHLAKAHTKGQENGKIRSIQGSVYSHYVLGNYWSRHLETTMVLKHATMNKTNSQLLLEKEDRRAASKDNTTTKVCLDYPDFGATHSLRQQSLVLDCMLEVAVSQGFKPTEEFLKIHKWYRDSFQNQWWLCPEDSTWYQAHTGMFSGVVQTTCFNTVMNGALRMHAKKTLLRMGTPIAMKRNYELGDDGWAEFSDETEAESYIAVFPLIGKELNPIKQLVSKYGSEYLREWYIDGKIYGCFARALAMLVSGNVESTIASAGVTRIRELYESYSALTLRLARPEVCQYYFEDLAVYEARRGALGRRPVLRFCYAPLDVGGLALRPIWKMPASLAPSGPVETDGMSELENQEEMAARVLVEEKVQNLFKASREYINGVEAKYRVTWKHSGKAKATAVIAASGIVSGRKKVTQATHDELEFLVIRCGRRERGEEYVSNELTLSRPVKIGVAEIEKQFRKQTVEDRILLAELSKLAKVFKYMNDECQDAVIAQVSGANNISRWKVEKTLQSLKYLKGEGFEYPPKSLLNSELMGIYSQWKVIQNFGNKLALPSILLELSGSYRT